MPLTRPRPTLVILDKGVIRARNSEHQFFGSRIAQQLGQSARFVGLLPPVIGGITERGTFIFFPREPRRGGVTVGSVGRNVAPRASTRASSSRSTPWCFTWSVFTGPPCGDLGSADHDVLDVDRDRAIKLHRMVRWLLWFEVAPGEICPLYARRARPSTLGACA